MNHRKVLGLVAPLVVVALAGCARGDDEPSVTATAKRADLPVMVLPQRALGEWGKELVRDRSNTGWIPNRAMPKEAPELGYSRRKLARSGRLTGYEATYIDPKGFRPRKVDGAHLLGTEVELLRDEAAASAYLVDRVAALAETQGRVLRGVTVADTGRFEVDDVGDEAHGVTVVVTKGDLALFTTSVVFRRGRIVGWADVLQAVELDSSGEMTQLAAALDERIQKVMAN